MSQHRIYRQNENSGGYVKYRRIVLFVFLLLVGSSLIYALVDKKKVTTSSDKAYQAYLRGEDYLYKLYSKEALDEFEQAARLDPNFAMAHARIAWLYRDFDRKADYQKAREKALSLLDKVHGKEKLLINLGFARADSRTADAEQYAKELLEKYPKSVDALEYQSGRALMTRNYDQLIEANLELLKLDPNRATSYNLLGYAYFYKGKYDKALEYIDKYSSLAQDQANPRDSHGELLLYLGRYDEALVQFRMADSIKSGLSFVVSHIAAAYAAKGMYRDAIGAYLKAKDLPTSEKGKNGIEYGITDCYIKMNQREKAVELISETLARNPDDLFANAILGGIYAEMGQIDQALIQLGSAKTLIAKIAQSGDTAYSAIPPSAAADYLNGQIAMARKNYDDAAVSFKRIVDETRFPEQAFFNALLARAYLGSGKADSAVDVLTSSLRDNPNLAPLLKILADAYAQLGQKDAQRTALTRYLTVMKDADDDVPDVLEARTKLTALNSKIF